MHQSGADYAPRVATPPSVLMVELVMSVDRLITSARAATPPTEGWPPAVIVAHVGDVDDEVWSPRLELMVAAFESGDAAPSFVWWEPDADVTYAKYADHTLDEAGARLMAARISLLTRLRDLTPEQWAATAHHDVYGLMDVTALVMEVLSHDEEHRGSLVLPAG